MNSLSTFDALVRLLSLSDHNTRVVLAGVALLGVAAGTIGSFMVLRRRAMVSDVVSHAALPGIATAFLLTAGGVSGGKALPLLLLGALISGALGMVCVHAITAWSKVREDAALGIVLSVFFGLGVALLGIAQRMPGGSAAGLESFIYGKTASMLASDARLMGGAALVAVGICLLLFKELRLVCFDAEFARAQGWPVRRIDAALTALVVAITVIGLQAVGLILMIALLVIPPAAARFWTDRLGTMTVLAAVIGAGCGVIGAGLSALYPSLPAGAMIVLSCTAVFAVSLIAGSRRGLVRRWIRQAGMARAMRRQHLLRALYEAWERQVSGAHGEEAAMLVPLHALIEVRGGTSAGWTRALRAAAREGDVDLDGWPVVRLTAEGRRHARKVVRNHRLWEWYLITHADVAADHVDRDADTIEHVLGEALVEELERTLADHGAVPTSPHRIAPEATP